MTKENVDLSGNVIGSRIFKIGTFNKKSLDVFAHHVHAVADLDARLQETFSDRAPRVLVITNSDLAEEGVAILERSGLPVIQADKQLAIERSRFAKQSIEGSSSKGDFSYADMLNALIENGRRKKVREYFFISPDIADASDAVSRQLIAMKIVFDRFERASPGTLSIVGSTLKGVHDPRLVDDLLEGTASVTLENCHSVFPNNAFSLVPNTARFSGITDNGIAGEIEIDGKFEPVGGNEDFLYAFEAMLFEGKHCALIVEPSMQQGSRHNENKPVESKYTRRPAVYRLYAESVILRARERGLFVLSEAFELDGPTIEAIAEEVLDEHLFFARLDKEGRLEVMLTARQHARRVRLPL